MAQRPVKAVRLLGQDLVLFRDGQGRWGLLDRACPHRGADLAFGRHEPEGLRCPFHGWKFATDGRCLETPAEPAGSTLCTRSASAAIRCRSAPASSSPGSGRKARRRPSCRRSTPSSRRRATASPSRACGTATGCRRSRSASIRRIRRSCTATSQDESSLEAAYGRQFRAASAGEVGGERWPMTRVMREFCQPEIRFESVAEGLLRLTTLRPMTDELTHVRVTHAAFPATFVIPLSETITITQMHVPVDDTHTYWYSFFTSFDEPLDKETMRAQRLACVSLPDYAPQKGRHNHWGFDAEEQRTPHLPRHGRGRHQPARPVGGREHGRDPGPHAGAPRHHRQGDHGQPAHAAEGDRDGAQRRPAADGAGERRRGRPPSTAPTRSTASPRPRAGRRTGAAPPRPSAPARPGWRRDRRAALEGSSA